MLRNSIPMCLGRFTYMQYSVLCLHICIYTFTYIHRTSCVCRVLQSRDFASFATLRTELFYKRDVDPLWTVRTGTWLKAVSLFV